MIRGTQIAAVNTNTSQVKNAEAPLQTTENISEQNAFAEADLAAGFPSAKKGFDFARVPVKPGLQTSLSVQCCGKDGKPCSCPTCKANAEKEDEDQEDEATRQSTADAQSAEQSMVAEPSSNVAASMQGEGPESVQQQESLRDDSTASGPSAQLIVDDAAPVAEEGQLRKSEFLQQLRDSICNSIGPILATVGQTTEGCPYLNYWLNLYQEKSAQEIEATVRRYAPDSANARTAVQYISIVTQRALHAAEVWASTGSLSGIPEGAPTSLPGGESAGPQAAAGPQAQPAAVQAKEKNGGAKNVDDPAAIKDELGQGQPLNSGVRSRMETAFGMNFSHVRTHSDSNSASLSNRVNARAFTVGEHVAFGSGEYQPGTLLGDALIAHELAHTVQQKGAATTIGKMEPGSSDYNALEKDADNAAVGAVSSLWGEAKNGLKTIGERVMPQLRSGLRIQGCRSDSSHQPQPSSSAPRVTFAAAAACTAFDDTISPNAIMVKTGGTNTVNATISPTASASSVTFESTDTGKATVSPAAAAGSPQAVTITGVAAGATEVRAKEASSGAVLKRLRVSVKSNLAKTVALHSITETNVTPNLVPTNAPATAGVETYLNDTVWGNQANVTFTVSRSDHNAAYDLDSNGQLADPELVSATNAEINAISAAAKDTAVNFNVYFINAMEVPHAFTLPSRAETWMQDTHTNSTENVLAHELGHALGIGRESANRDDVMFSAGLASNPCEVRKRDWDDVNP